MREISERRYQNLLKHEEMERKFSEIVKSTPTLHNSYVVRPDNLDTKSTQDYIKLTCIPDTRHKKEILDAERN